MNEQLEHVRTVGRELEVISTKQESISEFLSEMKRWPCPIRRLYQ